MKELHLCTIIGCKVMELFPTMQGKVWKSADADDYFIASS